MCILITKRQGFKDLPTLEQLKNCFENNEDGAGVAWTLGDGQIHFQKGFMNWKDFETHEKNAPYRKESKRYAVLYHFRMATHGTISKGNCHPFILSSRVKDLKQTGGTTSLPVVGHNGIIDIKEKKEHKSLDLSDTMIFIKEILSSNEIKDYLDSVSIGKLIEHYIGSGKVAVLLPNGRILHYNKHRGMVDKNVWYSNDGYKQVATNFIYQYTNHSWKTEPIASKSYLPSGIVSCGWCYTIEDKSQAHYAPPYGWLCDDCYSFYKAK